MTAVDSTHTDGTFAVRRLDDAGNEFHVQGGLSHAEALALAEHYESLGHHQMYFVRPEADGGTAAAE